MPKIKTIANTRKRLADRFKLICGHRVTVGKTYSGLTVLDGESYTNEELKALYFENGTLLLSSKDQKYFVLASGDLASWGNRIIAERVKSCIRFNEPITAKTNFSQIKHKNHWIPPAMIEYIIKGTLQQKAE